MCMPYLQVLHNNLQPAKTLARILLVAYEAEHLRKNTAQTFLRNLANVNNKELKINCGYKTRIVQIYAFQNTVMCLTID
jgi:hypothetical protein